jgi:hypothetical protein
MDDALDVGDVVGWTMGGAEVPRVLLDDLEQLVLSLLH